MGGLIGFELIRAIRRERLPMPIHFFVSTRRAPQLTTFYSPLHNLPEAKLIKELKLYRGTPEIVFENEELKQLFLPIIRADFSHNYHDE